MPHREITQARYWRFSLRSGSRADLVEPVYQGLTCLLRKDYPALFPEEVRCFGQSDEGRIGGALKKTILSIFLVMLVASVMFAQTANHRSTTGTTTNATSGSCTSTSSTSTGTSTSSASQRSQALTTPAVVGTRSKVAAVIEGVHAVRVSQSSSMSTGTSGGVLLPSTVVPFRSCSGPAPSLSPWGSRIF
jgi:hypothetical protein